MVYNSRSDEGFTLLEVMIALAIVAIALVTLLGLSNRSIQVQGRIQKMTRATLLAQQLMSEQEIIDPATRSWEPQEEAFEPPFADFRWQISYQDTLLDRVKQVNVVVLWGDPARNEQIELISFVEGP
jgi:general secretion pathway protein I